jgi:hypothetical protein
MPGIVTLSCRVIDNLKMTSWQGWIEAITRLSSGAYSSLRAREDCSKSTECLERRSEPMFSDVVVSEGRSFREPSTQSPAARHY